MKAPLNRREFLTDVGRGMIVASIGGSVAADLGLAPAFADDAPERLAFGKLEPLVRLMQETPAAKLLPTLVEKLRTGTELRDLVAAAAFANARTFGGEDYIGFHTMMALAPALHMSRELPAAQQPLPVLKVLYRNTNRIQETGGGKTEVLHPIAPAPISESGVTGETLRDAVRGKNTDEAEKIFAAIARGSAADALNGLLYTVHENTEVHRIVMPYRVWDLLELIGQEQAHTLLRQSVRYCLRSERGGRSATWDEPRTLLPKLLDQHKLTGRTPGTRRAEDAWVDALSQTFCQSTGAQAAAAAAAALEEGFAPADIAEAISLAANQLVLRDPGRSAREEVVGKPMGSVHGDSIGVHASDSANAWRNLARVGNSRNTMACVILGAFQVAFDRTANNNKEGNFNTWKQLPLQQHLDRISSMDAAALLREAEEAVRQNMQARAAAAVHRYGTLGKSPRPVFDMLLNFATSEDGALHAEKYYRTVTEEFAATRAAFRWRHLTALARVTASEFGRPAPGMAEARGLLKV